MLHMQYMRCVVITLTVYRSGARLGIIDTKNAYAPRWRGGQSTHLDVEMVNAAIICDRGAAHLPVVSTADMQHYIIGVIT